MNSCVNCSKLYSVSNSHANFVVCSHCFHVNPIIRNYLFKPEGKEILVRSLIRKNQIVKVDGISYQITGCIYIVTNGGNFALWNLNDPRNIFSFIMQQGDRYIFVNSLYSELISTKDFFVGAKFKPKGSSKGVEYRINFMCKVLKVYGEGEISMLDFDFSSSVVMTTFTNNNNDAILFLVGGKKRYFFEGKEMKKEDLV